MAVIYALEHKDSGKAYVGSTAAKLNKRMREHRCLLRNHKHTSNLLQADWDKYGEDAFGIRILEDLGDDVQFEVKKSAEQRWIDEFEAKGLIYNAYTVAFSMPIETTRKGVEAARRSTGLRWTPEMNLRRRLAQLGKPKGHGAKISATKRAKRAAMLAMACDIV
jgi:group I intron endonuclease